MARPTFLTLGVRPAFLLALQQPQRARRLVVIEALLGRLPGAERFLADGPPWWFGFHSVPGPAERVLTGHEAEYVDLFLRAGTADGRGVTPSARAAFVRAYAGEESLRCAFAHYRALPTGAAQLADAVAGARLTVPTMAVGARPVGDALFRQLGPITDDLVGHVLDDCGHIVPEDRPRELLGPFLR